jgi:hypothetical protein
VELGRDVHELVEPAGDEVCELHLTHGLEPLGCGADRRADDRVLGQRSVQHPVDAELLGEPVRDLERPAEDADVLAEAEHGLVAPHLLAQAVGDGLQIRHLPGAVLLRLRLARGLLRNLAAARRCRRRVGHAALLSVTAVPL